MYGQWLMDLYVKPWYLILLQDVVNAFYLFQIFSLSAWMTVAWYQYGTTMIFMISVSLYGEFSNIYENLYNLKRMAHYECEVQVKRRDNNGNPKDFETTNSKNLVPGDVFTLKEGQNMPCDAILLNGESIMNEAMLTGESLPAVKEPISNSNEIMENFSVESKKHVSFWKLIIHCLEQTLLIFRNSSGTKTIWWRRRSFNACSSNRFHVC